MVSLPLERRVERGTGVNDGEKNKREERKCTSGGESGAVLERGRERWGGRVARVG